MPRAKINHATFRATRDRIYEAVLGLPIGHTVTFAALSEIAGYNVQFRRHVVYRALDLVMAERDVGFVAITNEGYKIIAQDGGETTEPPALQSTLALASEPAAPPAPPPSPWDEAETAMRRAIEHMIELAMARARSANEPA